MSDIERRRRVRSGVLVRAGSRTFRGVFAPSTMLGELAAAVLDCGPGAVASGPSAAALHGFDGFRLRRPLHVMVGRGRNVQRAHLHVHTSSELPLIDRATVEGVAALSATRTVIDLARFVGRPTSSRRRSTPRCVTGSTCEDLLHRRIASLRIQRALRDPAAARRDRGQRDHAWWPQLARAPVPRAVRVGEPAAPADPASAVPGAGPAGARRLPLPRHAG